MEVRFCPTCSQIVHRHYLFCPQCGAELQFSPDLSVLLDRCLKPLEEMELRNNCQRLSLLLSRLELLDEGLELFLEQGTKDCDDLRKDRQPSCR